MTLRGWLYNKRSSGKLHFLELRDGFGLVQCEVGLWNVVQQVSDEDARESPVGEREFRGVCRGKRGIGQLVRCEVKLARKHVDADAAKRRYESNEVVAFAAADFETRRPKQRNDVREKIIFGFGDAGRASRPEELFGVGFGEVGALGFAEALFGSVGLT